MSVEILRIATRSSPLALWQANDVKQRLEAIHPNLTVELLPIKTQGDKILDTPLAKIGGKGLFIKELEEAMLAGIADIAVHSMKDVPMELPPGFELPVICERDDPRDAFVSNHFDTLMDLPQGARLGTSSLRRQSQMQALRPDLDIISLRGNVQTRLQRLDEERFDAIMLAAAGLRRLGLHERIRSNIAPEQCLPAVGQGAVGIECREGDEKIKALLAPLNHADTWDRVIAERTMNRRLEGGCQVPIAGYAELEGDTLWLRGLVASEDGTVVYTAEGRAPRTEAEVLGTRIAEDLLSQGAGVILQAIYARA